MTISSTTVRNSYSGDASTTTFSYTFKIFADSDIQVIIRSANGTETTKTITTHYTVTGAGNSGGGSVIFTSGNIPTATQTVVLRRNIPQTQAIDYIANDPFPAESHEEGLDRATMAIQQLQEELTRSIKLSKTNTMTSTEFSVGASDRANKILAFDTNGELAVTQELGTNRGNWATATTFNGRDIVKDSSNNNIYLCNTTHTSTGTTPISSNVDVAKWDLIVDAAAATNSANSAANSASNASNFANAASNHASNASNHASNSSNFANNSSNSANTSATYLAGVSANANASANSAANASNFANNSSNSANSSANHSSNSSNFANNSSNHASNSSNFANNSSNSANSASASATTATTQAGFASSNAATATTQAGFATANATLALGYSSNSSNFANNSSNFANTASNAANAANAARDTVLASADSFDDVYLGAKGTDPTLDNDGDALTSGDLYYNTTGNVLKYYTGSAWVSITSGGITDLVQDTTPQLGGALDVNGNSIVSTSNGNIVILPNGSGKVSLDGIFYPTADGTNGQFIKTDGAGNLSFGSSTLSYSSGTATGNASTTAFTISSGRTVEDVLVFVNGFQLTPTTDYTISGTTLTFQTAPANSAEITYRYLPLGGAYTSANFTGNGSATTITIDSGRAVADILVVVNGLTLVPTDDYTISGTTLTFATAPANLAEITVRYLRLS
jgi:trimeric autotransporter adhesin